jgi:hypothetical protein
VYNRFVNKPQFLFDDSGALVNDAPYFIPGGDRFLTAYLNSKVCWFMILSYVPDLRGGYVQINAAYIQNLPIPSATDCERARLAVLARKAQQSAEARYKLQQDVTRRISDLSMPGKPAKLTDKLKAWWDFPDFAAFRAEVKKAFKADIPLAERTDWENWIAKTRPEIHALTAEIARIEREIDTRVYALFDLTADEIALLEASI